MCANRFVIVVAAVMLAVPLAGLQSHSWRPPDTHEQLLPGSVDGWEPALAVGPRDRVFIVAGRRAGPPGAPGFDQRLVIWRSDDAGATFSAPVPLTAEGYRHADQRIAVDTNGTLYVSYMDRDSNERGRSVGRLRLARSRDEGRTFSVETVTTERVGDKPELAISPDGTHLYIVYESSPGPRLIASHDGGATWSAPAVVVPAEGRHFFPEGLAVSPDGGVWFAVPTMSDADIAAQRQTPVQLHVFHSTDNGRTWTDDDFGASPRTLKGCVHNPECAVKASDIGVAVDARGQAHVIYTAASRADQPFGLFHRSTTDGGRRWSEPRAIGAAPRPQSGDAADHDYPIVTAAGDGRVCAVWVDDRRGALDVWARCSTDGARTWGPDVLLSDRADGAAYKSAAGFRAFYGHYGGAAISASGRLHAVWAAGEPGYRTGTVWTNSIDVSQR